MMHLVGSTGIDIEGDAELLKAIFHHYMVLVHDLLRAYPFSQSPDCDGHAMFIAGADKFNVSFPGSLVPDINIGRQVAASYMADMQGAIGIR